MAKSTWIGPVIQESEIQGNAGNTQQKNYIRDLEARTKARSTETTFGGEQQYQRSRLSDP